MYFLIDGENLDATLGVNILGRAPRAEERPRWDRVLDFDPWQDQPSDGHSISGLFFLNATEKIATSFVQALMAIGWRPLLLTSEDPNVKVVDRGIQRTLEAIAKTKPGTDIVLGSHDADYLPQIEELLDAGHRVSILCFREFLSTSLASLQDRGLTIIDLEYDVHAFNQPLSRIHAMDVEEFDPLEFI
ncbi:NYN domain-containing protein [Arcanobacterium canis]